MKFPQATPKQKAEFSDLQASLLTAIKNQKFPAGARVEFAAFGIGILLAHSGIYVGAKLLAPTRRIKPAPRRPTAAQELAAFAAAFAKLKQASANLSPRAVLAMNLEKDKRGLVWSTPSTLSFKAPSEFRGFLDHHFPDIENTASEAANNVRHQRVPSYKGDHNMRNVSSALARWFEMLTGKTISKVHRDDSKFVGFVQAIFDAANIKKSAKHYANLGAAHYLAAK